MAGAVVADGQLAAIDAQHDQHGRRCGVAACADENRRVAIESEMHILAGLGHQLVGIRVRRVFANGVELGMILREIQVQDGAAVRRPIGWPHASRRQIQPAALLAGSIHQPKRRVPLAVEKLLALGPHERVGDFERSLGHRARLSAPQRSHSHAANIALPFDEQAVIAASVVVPGSPVGPTSAAAVALDHEAGVAAHADSVEVPVGDYLYTESIVLQFATYGYGNPGHSELPGTVVTGPSQSFSVLRPVTRQVWSAANGSGRLREVFGAPTFPTNTDRAALNQELVKLAGVRAGQLHQFLI